MENNEKIVDVKNLRISFKTNTGTVKAVRGIDFSLYRGRTLAIVGESGSGKSVTSKAILGILANNKIVEDGEIIYDGKDLLTLPESKFSKVRGVKISMIFQDPLSALNPIMKVGKQLTEAMYLEHKAVKKNSKKAYKALTAIINPALDAKSNEEKIQKELDSHLANLNAALSKARDYQANFENEEGFEANKAKAELASLSKALLACKTPLEIDADDVIDVYSVLMSNKIKAYKNAIVLKQKREALLKEFNVDDIYGVPAKSRIKEREVITDSTTYFASMKKLTAKLIAHLEEVIAKFSSLSISSYSESILALALDLFAKMNSELTSQETKARAIELMREVGIPEPERRYNQYPFEFSGGMRQRIVIAIALSGNPEVLICDEPTTALDVTIQAQILELINKLKKDKNLSIIFITHDLGVVANMADDIAVMYAGKIVEYGSVYDVFYDPRHPYTWALLGSMPDLDTKGKLDAIPGTPPNMLLPPRGDAFAARNSYAIKLDYEQEPPFFKVSESHYAKTWLAHKNAPDVKAPETVINRIQNSLSNNSKNKPTYDLKKNSILEMIKKGAK